MPSWAKPISDTNFWVDELHSPVILKCPYIGKKSEEMKMSEEESVF